MLRDCLPMRRLAVTVLLLLATELVPVIVHAQEQQTLLLLRPHCEETITEVPEDFVDRGTEACRHNETRDPSTKQTAVLRVDDILDLDVVVYNPQRRNISRVRSWLSYDREILEGLTVSMGSSMPVTTPGEADFDAESGTVRIGTSAEEGTDRTDIVIPVARVQLKIKRAPDGSETPIVFQDLQDGLDGHTFVAARTDDGEENALRGSAGTLIVRVQTPQTSSVGQTSSAGETLHGVMPNPFTSTESQTSSSTAPAPVQPAATTGGRSSFVLLQIQGVRATSDRGGSTVYVAWEPLRSAELAGYNVYYGTERGRYIQRHSVTPDSTSAALRGLLQGTVYYIAVRGVNTRNEETSFSREITIRVGDPLSSNAPLTLQSDPNGRNPLTRITRSSSADVPGESGPASTIVILLLGCAAIGTLFACRRQLAVFSVQP